MKNTIRFAWAAGVVALVAALAVPVMWAQGDPPQGPPMGRRMGPPPGGPMGPGGPGGPMGVLGGLGKLDLTDAQKEQVRSIMQSHQQEFQQVGEKMRAAREALGDAIEADSPIEDTIRAKAADVGLAEGDQAVLGAKVRAEVFAILTAEQQQKVKDLQAERQARRQQMQQQGRQRRPGRQQRH